ncbi:MAG TPA: oxidoreductase-like domain-containing protein [Casimicrobiaceae bacterium]|nr:oxidoreductase-like domain-containing protein [Casimicrobiaceae bacterium]
MIERGRPAMPHCPAPPRSASATPETPPDDDPPPLPPSRPASADCCRGGCDPCVFDLYDAALERYEAELLAWRRRRDEKSRRKHAGRRRRAPSPRSDAPRQRCATPAAV